MSEHSGPSNVIDLASYRAPNTTPDLALQLATVARHQLQDLLELADVIVHELRNVAHNNLSEVERLMIEDEFKSIETNIHQTRTNLHQRLG